MREAAVPPHDQFCQIAALTLFKRGGARHRRLSLPREAAILTCKLCDWLWKKSDAWEVEHSNDIELWWEESDQSRELTEQAYAILKTDPAAACRLFLEAAESGSTLSMKMIGWHYHTGTYVEADFAKAQEYYYRAICAGSWMATLNYAKLLADHGYHDHCEKVLEDGVASDFVPAYFWLAWFRYKRSKSREVCQEIRPMLEYAARKGHPGAKLILGRLMLFGKFGIRGIPEGFKFALRSALESAREDGGRQGVVGHIGGRE